MEKYDRINCLNFKLNASKEDKLNMLVRLASKESSLDKHIEKFFESIDFLGLGDITFKEVLYIANKVKESGSQKFYKFVDQVKAIEKELSESFDNYMNMKICDIKDIIDDDTDDYVDVDLDDENNAKNKKSGSKSGYEPTDKKKWAAAKAWAKRNYDVYPSAYANLAASKKYKKMGGGWRKKKTKSALLFSELKKISSAENNLKESPIAGLGESRMTENVAKREASKLYNDMISLRTYAEYFSGSLSPAPKAMYNIINKLPLNMQEKRNSITDYESRYNTLHSKVTPDHFVEILNSYWVGQNKNADLRRWLKENWVNVKDPSKPCGRDNADKGKYPKCRPKDSVKNMSKEERKSAVRRKRKAESKDSEKNDGKARKPNYVSTKKK